MKKEVMRWLGMGLALLLVSGCVSSFYRYQSKPSLPDYNARLKAPGLRAEVHVYRDDYGVPHIFADDPYDLFFAIGYTQAQDRLWEMMLLRAVAEGRSAELLGRLKVPGASFKGFPIDTLQIDRQQRSMGMKFIGEAAEALVREKRPDIYLQLKAYSDGVNHFLATHQKWEELPVEFQILRVKPEPWRPADSLSFGRLMGFILGYNMLVELWRYGLITKYGEEVGWQITCLHDVPGPTIVPPEYLHNKLPRPRALPPGGRPSSEELGYQLPLSASAAFQLLAALDFIRKNLSADLPFASNSYLVGPKLTTTGAAMLENDTHLPHLQPSIWYLSHVMGAGYNSYGVMFPGTPYHALGHTPKLAWSATTSIADVQDLFVETVDEKNHPGQYLYQGKWLPFTVRKEKIRVREGFSFSEMEVEVKQTVHGPVLSSFLPLPAGTPPVALRWVAWDFSRNQKVFQALVSSATVEDFMAKVKQIPATEWEMINTAFALERLMRGETTADFMEAMRLVDLPSQNWAAADAGGNIVYLPGGLIPLRKKGLGVMPVPGASGDFDWAGFVPLSEHPQLINPDRGYIVTANNEVVDAEWYPYLFSLNYDSGWRAWRIEELIQKLAPIDLADMKTIQNDVYVKKAELEVPRIIAAFARKQVKDPQALKGLAELKKWDYQASLDSTATAVFFNYVEQMRKNVLGDEVSPEDFELFLKESQSDIVIDMLIKKGQSPLFDDKRTPALEDLDDMMVASVKDSVAFLEKKYGKDPKAWTWGKVHPIKFFHPLGFGPFHALSVGPFPMPGSRHTVRCASPAESGRWHFKDMNGPAWRHIIDLGDPEHALVVIDGSISGQYLSPHYTDLHQVWVRGDHLQAVMDPKEVKAQAKYHLVMMP